MVQSFHLFCLRVEAIRHVCDSSFTNGNQLSAVWGHERNLSDHATYHQDLSERVGGHCLLTVVAGHEKGTGSAGVEEILTRNERL
jgi:hypothetical protein